jgi:predicted Zn finger-like uncharacterized protein
MIIVCPSCQSRYRFDESKLGERPRARTRCSKCGGTIDIENPRVGAMTLPPSDLELPVPPAPPAPAAPEPKPAERPTSEDTTRTHRKLTSIPEQPTGQETITGQDIHKMGILELPRDKRYALAVIQGPATGQIFQISKTRTTLGRSGCDINLNDPECSRQHAVVEIFGERIVLRDLDSTNGTFIESERIEHYELTNHMEFRLGSHVLMLIVTEIE